MTRNSIFLKSVAQHMFKTSHKISFTFYENINDTDTCLTLMLSFKSTSFWRRNKGSFCGSSLTKGVPGKRKRKQVNAVKLWLFGVRRDQTRWAAKMLCGKISHNMNTRNEICSCCLVEKLTADYGNNHCGIIL